MTSNIRVLPVGKDVADKKNTGPSFRAFDDLAVNIATCAKSYNALIQSRRELDYAIKNSQNNWANPDCMDSQIKVAEEVLEQRKYRTTIHESIKKDLAAFSPEDDPDLDENGNPNRKYIARQIGVLLGSFPSGSPAEPEVYTRMLIEEVLATESFKHSIEGMNRRARRTLKFLPTISEILDILKEEEKLWDMRFTQFYCDTEIEWLAEKIEAAKTRKIEMMKAEEERVRIKSEKAALEAKDREENPVKYLFG